MSAKLKIGVDVGGTNTDAAVLAGDTILGSCKVSTSVDVTDGVHEAVTRVLSQTAVNPGHVSAVMVGTTHFLNALVQRKHLSRTGTFRLCGPTGRALPPMVDWPEDLKTVVNAGAVLEDGGVEFDGRTITPVNPEAIRTICRQWRADGVNAVAVSSVFSLVDSTCEAQVASIVAEELPDADISLSHQIGQNGLLQRESATILNASLQALAKQTVTAFEQAFARLDLNATLYLTQNDGTLMSADYAVRYPVHTIASGPTNSMRGAAFLTGLLDAAVVDIGGTTTDIGIVSAGFPRTRSEGATIAGVRTNFRMPDVLSLALGGGSKVQQHPHLKIGPTSVGYLLSRESMCFGGNTLTATDIAVALGRARPGCDEPECDEPGREQQGTSKRGDIEPVYNAHHNASRLEHLDPGFLSEAQTLINTQIATTIDRMKLSANAIPAVFVGGGSFLVDGELDGVSEVIVPEHAGAANAIGAAIAQVSGEADSIVSLDQTTREKALQDACAKACEKAIAAGADKESIVTADIIESPLAYLPGNAVRLTVKVVGDLAA